LNFIGVIALLISFVTLISCGKKDSLNKKFVSLESMPKKDEGIFRANILPLNSSLTSVSSGEIKIIWDTQMFLSESKVVGSDPGVKHLQFIMSSSQCPSEKDDLNHDSVIDMNELLTVSGDILIPLDSDVSEQLNGIDFGPISNEIGDYIYRRSSSRIDLLNDLTLPDPDFYDHVGKISQNDNLEFNKRVVVILGVSSDKDIPQTVKSFWDLPVELSIPIGCGKFEESK
jgi:hypothetical protein